MTMVPQYSPVQPTGRSHPATRTRLASAAQVRPARGRAVGMAPKISPRCLPAPGAKTRLWRLGEVGGDWGDRKSTRLNSSHLVISYAVFCLKKKKLSNAP